VAAALAEVAAKNNYVRPALDADHELKIVNGRHPVVEQSTGVEIGERFVPNDAHFHATDRIQIITGPNMSGKSTYLRQPPSSPSWPRSAATCPPTAPPLAW
jgi:DNA mismatch repair protein MutS